MTMKRTLYLWIVAGFILSTFSCTYDEGPWISLRTKASRLDGHWTVVEVINNGENTTSFYPEDYGYKFDKNGSFKKVYNAVETPGTWEFSDDKTEAFLTYTNSPDADAYYILRLTNKQLWWKRTVDTDVIEEHFEVKK